MLGKCFPSNIILSLRTRNLYLSYYDDTAADGTM